MRTMRKMNITVAAIAWITGLFAPIVLDAQEIQKVSLPLPPDMVRADLYALKTTYRPKAVLVLCPGANGNGEFFLQQEEWREFAKLHRLGLVGLSFASDGKFLNDGGRGYYYASKGSGQALLSGLRKIYGIDLPVLLYGFSGGAHFTSRFTEWKPKRVLAWCAYSAAWWDVPQKAVVNPPGIVACGDEDFRLGVSLIYFKQGRAAGKPWLWINLPNVGHATSPQLEVFIRQYFAAILNTPASSGSLSSQGLWLDIDLKTPVSKSQQKDQPSLTGWLPDKELFESWKTIHKP